MVNAISANARPLSEPKTSAVAVGIAIPEVVALDAGFWKELAVSRACEPWKP